MRKHGRMREGAPYSLCIPAMLTGEDGLVHHYQRAYADIRTDSRSGDLRTARMGDQMFGMHEHPLTSHKPRTGNMRSQHKFDCTHHTIDLVVFTIVTVATLHSGFVPQQLYSFQHVTRTTQHRRRRQQLPSQEELHSHPWFNPDIRLPKYFNLGHQYSSPV